MIKYEHLLGQPFDFGKSDCYSIVRDFYKDNYDIELPNYARPTQFWDFGLDMYMERFRKNGFTVLNCNPHEYVPGDVFLMSIQSTVANHAGILIEKGMMLHHLVNQISTVTPYRSLWRNSTMAVVRHKDVKDLRDEPTANLLEHVPAHIRRKVNEYFEHDQTSVAQ